MLNAIGDAAMQQTVRVNYDSEKHDQNLAVKKSDQTRKKRPVEKNEDSAKTKNNITTAKNRFFIAFFLECKKITQKTCPLVLFRG